MKPFRQRISAEAGLDESTIQPDSLVEEMLLPVPDTTKDPCSSEDSDFEKLLISPKTKTEIRDTR